MGLGWLLLVALAHNLSAAPDFKDYRIQDHRIRVGGSKVLIQNEKNGKFNL